MKSAMPGWIKDWDSSDGPHEKLRQAFEIAWEALEKITVKTSPYSWRTGLAEEAMSRISALGGDGETKP